MKRQNKKAKKETKKGLRFGIFTQPSKLFHALYFQYNIFIYYTFKSIDTTLLEEPSARGY